MLWHGVVCCGMRWCAVCIRQRTCLVTWHVVSQHTWGLHAACADGRRLATGLGKGIYVCKGAWMHVRMSTSGRLLSSHTRHTSMPARPYPAMSCSCPLYATALALYFNHTLSPHTLFHACMHAGRGVQRSAIQCHAGAQSAHRRTIQPINQDRHDPGKHAGQCDRAAGKIKHSSCTHPNC